MIWAYTILYGGCVLFIASMWFCSKPIEDEPGYLRKPMIEFGPSIKDEL